MLNDSVVVSGLGPVSSIGIGRDAFRRGIEEGRVGTGPIRSFDTTGFPYVDAGEVVDFDPRAILTALDESEWGRSSLLAASAARLAFEDAEAGASGHGPGSAVDLGPASAACCPDNRWE